MIHNTEMPPSYTCCCAGEGTCPLRERCLRSLAHRERTRDEKLFTLTVVNLWNPALLTNTEKCKLFREARKVAYARGFSRLFDNVPKKDYFAVKARVQAVFGSERSYYYCKNGTWLASPREQARIAAIFRAAGLGETPPYDQMVECYDWG